jgi:hypothetical protein
MKPHTEKEQHHKAERCEMAGASTSRRRRRELLAVTVAAAAVPGCLARTKREQKAESSEQENCDAAYATHGCSQWPPQHLAEEVEPRIAAWISERVDAALEPFRASGVRQGELADLMRRPCVQRLCVRVQLIGGQLYVVAPEGMSLCNRGGSLKSRLSCPPNKRAWAEDMAGECMHRKHSTTKRYSRSEACNATSRMRQPGVTIPNFWSDFLYPHTLEWHFSAGLNMSSCRATGDHVPLPGDHNHVYTRLRLQTAMRMLQRSYQRLHALGRLSEPMELILCPNETPINLGDWCTAGAQPIFSATSNEHAPLIPYVQWVQGPDRDADLALWRPRHGSSGKSGGATSRVPAWDAKTPMAVFRGSVHRLSVYSARWRQQGPRRTSIARNNWHEVGRTALIRAKMQRPDLFNIRLLSHSVETKDSLPYALAIDNTTWASMDRPEFLPMSEQQRFKYSINVEGHGGWADRAYKLFLGPQLVLAQDMPAMPWYQRFLRAGVHYVPVDSNLANITQAVMWARAHDDEAQRMVVNANEDVRQLVTPKAMFRYSEAVLEKYAQLMRYQPTLHKRAVPFQCDEIASSNRTCKLHRAGAKPETMKLGETYCTFRSRDGGTKRFHTLYEASLALPS